MQRFRIIVLRSFDLQVRYLGWRSPTRESEVGAQFLGSCLCFGDARISVNSTFNQALPALKRMNRFKDWPTLQYLGQGCKNAVAHSRPKTWECVNRICSDVAVPTPGQQRHSGSSRDFYWLNATARCLRQWNVHFLSFWLAISLFFDVCYVTMNEKFSWELVHCCVPHITERW